MIEPILLGITSSLVATFMFFSGQWLISHVLIPWYLDKVYPGVRVQGNWHVSLVNGRAGHSDLAASMILTQKANKVSGVYSHHRKDGSQMTPYNLRGEISDGLLSAQLRPVSKTSMDPSTMMLQVSSGEGTLILRGMILRNDSGTKNIEGATVEFKRDIAKK